MSDIYKKATRLGLLFPIRGNITITDLWKVPLTELTLAYKGFKDDLTELTVGDSTDEVLAEAAAPSAAVEVLKLKVEILKDVILTRREENKEKAASQQVSARIAELKVARDAAAQRDLANKSPEEIDKMIADLQKSRS
jgi:hypothetical protein